MIVLHWASWVPWMSWETALYKQAKRLLFQRWCLPRQTHRAEYRLPVAEHAEQQSERDTRKTAQAAHKESGSHKARAREPWEVWWRILTGKRWSSVGFSLLGPHRWSTLITTQGIQIFTCAMCMSKECESVKELDRDSICDMRFHRVSLQWERKKWLCHQSLYRNHF